MTVNKYEEINRRLGMGQTVRQIARSLGCSRNTIRNIRDGTGNDPNVLKKILIPPQYPLTVLLSIQESYMQE